MLLVVSLYVGAMSLLGFERSSSIVVRSSRSREAASWFTFRFLPEVWRAANDSPAHVGGRTRERMRETARAPNASTD